MEQTLAIAENVRNGNLEVPKEMKDSFLSQFDMSEAEKAAADQEGSERRGCNLAGACPSVAEDSAWLIKNRSGHQDKNNQNKKESVSRKLSMLHKP